MNNRHLYVLGLIALAVAAFFIFLGPAWMAGQSGENTFDIEIRSNMSALFEEGKRVFRFETFGDEAFWGDTLKLHRAIAGEKLGGVGPGLSPKKALEAGLKVDAEALPPSLVADMRGGNVDLNDPATTVALLKLNAVVGVKAFMDEKGAMRSVGIECALCHSTVDDSFAPGIGHRLDGWANRDLNVGAIISLAPDLSAVTKLLGTDEVTVKKVLAAWGPGKFDAILFLDGKGFRPDGKTAATLIPPAFGMAGVNMHTFTGWGSVTYWNAFVANLEMHGQGTFIDSRLSDPSRFPIAAKARSGNTRNARDMVTSKLAALQFYQLAIPAPSADRMIPVTTSRAKPSAADISRGDAVFNGKAKCATCHVPPLFTEPGWNMHSPSDIGIDDFQANRSPDKKYRTTPLKGLWSHQKGGFYHDGRFATLEDVINHYDRHFRLSLTAAEKQNLIDYLLSL
jgi:hypothetical protein